MWNWLCSGKQEDVVEAYNQSTSHPWVRTEWCCREVHWSYQGKRGSHKNNDDDKFFRLLTEMTLATPGNGDRQYIVEVLHQGMTLMTLMAHTVDRYPLGHPWH